MKKVAHLSSTRVARSLDCAISSLRSFESSDNFKDGTNNELWDQKQRHAAHEKLTELADILVKHRIAISDRIITTVEEEDAYDSSHRKLAERYESALVEKDKLEKRLQAQRTEQAQATLKLESQLSKVRADLEAEGSRHEEKQCELDRRDLDEIDAAQSRHEETTRVLSGERLELELKLRQGREAYTNEESTLRSQRDILKADLDKGKILHDQEAHEMDAKITSLVVKMEREKSERAKLEEHFNRVDRNARERDKEEEMLRRVCEMEERADAILDHGAVQLQRLYRGLRVRAMLLKAKKKKGGKGGKGKGGKGKGAKAKKAKKVK